MAQGFNIMIGTNGFAIEFLSPHHVAFWL